MTITREDIQDMWRQVKDNRAKLDGCPRHLFPAGKVRIGQKMTCEHCGGQMGLTDIGDYIRGYEAGGGNADDIWPGFRGAKS